jgi:hypothetical protein
MLQLVSLVLVIYSYFQIQTSLRTLPLRIPTHFNAAGLADAWGSPEVLWVVFGAQALTCAVFLLVPYLSQRSPGAVHFGSRRLSDFPPAQRARAVALLNDLAGYLSMVMNLFFVFILREIIQAAAQPIPHIHVFLPLGILLGATFGIMLYYLGQFRRAAKGASGDDDGDPSDKLTC